MMLQTARAETDPVTLTIWRLFSTWVVGEWFESARCLIHYCDVLYVFSKKPAYSEFTERHTATHVLQHWDPRQSWSDVWSLGKRSCDWGISEIWIYKPLPKNSNGIFFERTQTSKISIAIATTYVVQKLLLFKLLQPLQLPASSFNQLLSGKWTLKILSMEN